MKFVTNLKTRVHHYNKSLPVPSMLDSDARVLFSRNNYIVIVPPSNLTTRALFAINMELAHNRHDVMLFIKELCESPYKLKRCKGTPALF